MIAQTWFDPILSTFYKDDKYEQHLFDPEWQEFMFKAKYHKIIEEAIMNRDYMVAVDLIYSNINIQNLLDIYYVNDKMGGIICNSDAANFVGECYCNGDKRFDPVMNWFLKYSSLILESFKKKATSDFRMCYFYTHNNFLHNSVEIVPIYFMLNKEETECSLFEMKRSIEDNYGFRLTEIALNSNSDDVVDYLNDMHVNKNHCLYVTVHKDLDIKKMAKYCYLAIYCNSIFNYQNNMCFDFGQMRI